MKIVYALHQFFPHHVTGTETYTYGLAKEMQRKGHEVAVLCFEHSHFEGIPSQGRTEDDFDGIPVTRFCFHPRLTPNFTFYEYYNPLMGEWGRAFLEEQKPDVVHFTHAAHITSAVIEAAGETSIPTMLTLTDFWFVCPRVQLLREDGELCAGPVAPTDCLGCFWSEFPNLYRKFSGLFFPFTEAPFSVDGLKRALPAYSRNPEVAALVAALHRKPFLQEILDAVDTIIAPSKSLMDMYRKYDMGTKKLQYLPFGLDTSHIGNTEKTSSSLARIAFIGTLAPHKGCRILVEAFRKEADERLRLDIYGSLEQFPDYAEDLQKHAVADDRIRFKGTFPQEDLGKVFSEIDVLVVPSVWYENTPLIVYSAFATKTPVIASNMGGLAEMIEPGVNGLLFEKGDVEGLQACLQQVVSTPGLLRKLAEGIKPVKTTEQHGDEILEEYYMLLKGQKNNSAAAL